MTATTIRVISRGTDGSVCTKDYDSFQQIEAQYEKIGIDDCSTNLDLRGFPIFKGLIGPMTEPGGLAVYESPEIFEFLTKEWSQKKKKRRSKGESMEEAGLVGTKIAEDSDGQIFPPPAPKFTLASVNANLSVNH